MNVQPDTPIIQAKGLTKRFRRPVKQPGMAGALRHLFRPEYTDFIAVDDIDLAVMPGESVAYVGPNGAGKSTTVKLLTGILVPTSGHITVCGLTPFEKRMENARNIGVVFGQRTQLWWDIPVQGSFRLLGDIYEVPVDDYRRTFAELVEVLDLAALLPVPARQLSLGQRMRCDLAASLIHSPPVLYLDEPTIGLDVAVKARFREFIRFMHAHRNLTVMLTSHDLGDIEELCDRMIMIDKGRIVYDGALPGRSHTPIRLGAAAASHVQRAGAGGHDPWSLCARKARACPHGSAGRNTSDDSLRQPQGHLGRVDPRPGDLASDRRYPHR
jgi:ABC-2 type transport system ATP-binding protein